MKQYPGISTIRSTLMLVLLCAVWGMTFPAMKAALAVTDPIHFLALRFVIAAVIMAPVMLVRSRRQSSRSTDSDDSPGARNPPALVFRRGALVGIFLFGGFALQLLGLKYTTASRSGFFTSLLVLFTPILATLFRSSRTRLATWIGLVPATVGVFLIADPDAGGLNRGDLLTIGCAFVFAIQMVVLEHLGRGEKDVWMLVYAQVLVVGGGALGWSVVAGRPFHIEPVGWAAALYTALFGSIVAVWLQTRYQPEVPAGHAALVFTLEPVFASIFAWVLLNETWTGRALVGAGFILLAMVVSSTGNVKNNGGKLRTPPLRRT